jgi:hypothetical protein
MEFWPSLLKTVTVDTWPLTPAGGVTVIEVWAGAAVACACNPSKKTRLSGPKLPPETVTVPSPLGVTEAMYGGP